MTDVRHLTETERHEAADAVLGADVPADIATHLAHCAECSADVARVRQLMTHVREAPPPVDTAGDLWPDIRARIEREKLIALPAASRHASVRVSPAMRRVLFGGAAAVVAALLLTVALPRSRGKGGTNQTTPVTQMTAEVRLAADSARAYEREATILLNELELRRAMIPPQRRTTIDHDLKVIDDAIVELKRAIEQDPNNAALRRMLASSYQHKIDVLKRAGG